MRQSVGHGQILSRFAEFQMTLAKKANFCHFQMVSLLPLNSTVFDERLQMPAFDSRGEFGTLGLLYLIQLNSELGSLSSYTC